MDNTLRDHGNCPLTVARLKDNLFVDARFGYTPKHYNLGIAILVPAFKLLEIWHCHDLVEVRKKIEDQTAQKELDESCPVLDSALEPRKPEFTQADFEAALKKRAERSSQRNNATSNAEHRYAY